MEQVSSTKNKLIKTLTKLKQKKQRKATGLYLIEGFHLVEEALKFNNKFVYLLGTQDALARIESDFDIDLENNKVILINDIVAEHLSTTKNSQNIFMVLKISQPKNYDLSYGKWVLLDRLTDPGNVGTIIRTADAAGFAGVILSPESVDIYNPKTQRAMQGSQFHLKIVTQDLPTAISALRNSGIPVYCSMLDKKAKQLPDFDSLPQVGLIIGNEAHGVSPNIAELSDEKLYIPIKGKAESLNAAVAAGIIIYHFA